MKAIPGDSPITSASQDLLSRKSTANVLASEIRRIDASQGYIVGVLGPWGSGKTSLVNLVRNELAVGKVIPVLEFNPWMFSGAEQLVERFFHELASQLRLEGDKLQAIAEDLENYGEIFAPLDFVPIVGPWRSRLTTMGRAMNKLSERRSGEVGELRKKLIAELDVMPSPLVVVLDDIDRLRSEEIRDIFKLVRLTANFPNLVYLLVFDRLRVENALDEDGLPGRDYLEKILQLVYNVPEISPTILDSILLSELNEALSTINPIGPFDEKRWHDVFPEIVQPLIKTMRDVRRYVAAAHVTATAVGEYVSLVDTLALEAVRVLRPNLFAAIVASQAGLTTPSNANFSGGPDYENPILKQSVQRILETSDDLKSVAIALVTRLFPAGQRHIGNMNYGPEWASKWLRDRLVAHPEILSCYLQRVVSKELNEFHLAEKAFKLLSDESALEAFMASVPNSELQGVIRNLEVFEGEYPVSALRPGLVVLLNLLPRMLPFKREIFGTEPQMTVRRVVLRMLRQVEEVPIREEIVRAVFPGLMSLSAKNDLLSIVGYEENAGHQLITSESWDELRTELQIQIRNSSPTSLVGEYDLLRVLISGRGEDELPEDPYAVPVSEDLDLALLRAASTEVQSFAIGNRAVTREQRLHWETLQLIFGSDDQLTQFVDRLSRLTGLDEESFSLIELAKKYADGWRPPNFMGE